MEITQKFQYGLIKASKEFENWKKAGGNYFNVFDALELGLKENYHSLFIKYLLDKDGEHYQSIFAEKFLKKLQNENIPSLNFGNLSVENLKSVEREAPTKQIKQNRRMDILLSFENDIHIIIENKISAPDQNSQIKAYVENIHKEKKKKNLSENQRYQKTLVIYLHPNDTDPSDMSFGKTSNRITRNYWYLDKERQYKIIRNSYKKPQAYFLKIDYEWIKSWIKECVKWFEKQAQSKREIGFDKIIAVLNQYIEILEWQVTDEWQDSEPVAEFVLENEKNQNMALAIMQDKKRKFDKELHEIVENSWDNIAQGIVKNFYKKLLKPFESEKGVKVGKYTWKAYRTDDKLGKTGWQIVFYKKERENLIVDYMMAFGFDESNFAKAYFAYGHLYYYDTKDEQEGYEKIVAKCKEFFKPYNKNGIKKDGDCYYEYLFNEKDNKYAKEYGFAEWIIEKGESAVAEFKAKFEEFIKKLETIKNAKQENIMEEVENYIRQKFLNPPN